jgi:hypothetical protein
MSEINSRMSRVFSSLRQEIKSKARCNCDHSRIHAHCLTKDCDARIPVGQTQCARCAAREQHRRTCRKCGNQFQLPEPNELSPPHMKQGLCSLACHESMLTTELSRAGLPLYYLESTLENFDRYSPGLERKIQVITELACRGFEAWTLSIWRHWCRQDTRCCCDYETAV